MPAQLITRFNNINPDGSIMELVDHAVEPAPNARHVFTKDQWRQYRLAMRSVDR